MVLITAWARLGTQMQESQGEVHTGSWPCRQGVVSAGLGMLKKKNAFSISRNQKSGIQVDLLGSQDEKTLKRAAGEGRGNRWKSLRWESGDIHG